MSTSPENQARIEALVASVWPHSTLDSLTLVQGLWNDYGAIVRVTLSAADTETNTETNTNTNTNTNTDTKTNTAEVGQTALFDSLDARQRAVPSSAIIKLVAPDTNASHPRGWNTQASNARKIASYKVEKYFYDQLAIQCSAHCTVAQPYATQIDDNNVSLVLEDLDVTYPRRLANCRVKELTPCIHWLAAFHARFMGSKASGVWPRGTYWHLGTREDEFNAMPDGALKDAAPALDAALFGCAYQTLLHGDAKVANFCFSNTAQLSSVAAVDFQYTGFGCGMQDLTYLLGSALDEQTMQTHEEALLDAYFQALRRHMGDEARQVQASWRPLYSVASADFHRFLLGWSPGHKKLTAYSEHLVTQALASCG